MKIRELPESDKQEYDELATLFGSIFNTTSWTNIYGNGVHRYGIYNNGNQLIGGFSIYREKKIGLSIYRNPAFTPSVGPFLKIDAKNPVTIANTWKEALSLMADFMDDLPYSVISICMNSNIKDTQPYIWKKFKVVPRYTYILDLTLSVEDLWMRMSSERRNDIRKGEKDGLVVKKITDYEIIRYLVNLTFTRQQMTYDSECLNKILFEFANNDNCFAFATYNDTLPISCVFCIYDTNKSYYLLGGYNPENRHHGAGALTMWQAIRFSRNLGLRFFDFEGSMVPQIERYFRGFGGQITPYYSINKAILPLEILLKFYKRELF